MCSCRFLCSDPLTSMKFIRFSHDSHIFHRLAFNKHYSHTNPYIYSHRTMGKVCVLDAAYYIVQEQSKKKEEATLARGKKCANEWERNKIRKHVKRTHIWDTFAPLSTSNPFLINNPNCAHVRDAFVLCAILLLVQCTLCSVLKPFRTKTVFVFFFGCNRSAATRQTMTAQCSYTQWLIYFIVLKMCSYMVIIVISMNRREFFCRSYFFGKDPSV